MDADEKLTAYLHGRLGVEDRAAFEAEIAGNPGLQAELSALRAAAAALGGAPVPPNAQADGWARLSHT